MTQCPACGTEPRPGTRFCPVCGTDLSGVPPIFDDPNSDAKGKAVLFYGLAGMMGFFAFGFLLPGLLAEPGFLFVSLALVLVATMFLLVGRTITRRERLRIEHIRNEWVVHGKCEYCGMQNSPTNRQCVSCGAPLGNRVR